MSMDGHLSAATKVFKNHTENMACAEVPVVSIGVFAFRTSALHIVDKDEALGPQKNTGEQFATAGFYRHGLTSWSFS